MFVAFLIMLREGIEAALIVGIIAGFLRQSGHSQLMPKVWTGVVLAALLCLALGVGLNAVTGEIPQKQQELVVGVIGLVAAAMITFMVFWMKTAAVSVKRQVKASVQTALNKGRGQGWALVGMAFLAVAREGLESVFFLLAVFGQSPTAAMPVGAVLGLLCAVVIGVLVYQGGMRLNLEKFFCWTGVFLIFVAAGLLAGSLRALHEAGVWNLMQEVVFDTSSVLHEDSPLGVLLGGFFGYTDHPTRGEVWVWLLYCIPALIWFLRGNRLASAS
ncbi:iron uptake transporter permease EfeU [Neisseria weaveri]|uniref:Integral membrane protein n=1 Tax=Neisseria weaveri TaxID=28091 RepID=A0A448VNJ6_9NEIS|nr:iron uptake transporter permease EfeU [Neisseria weaveri]EGV35137.1 ferrous iron permease EfeU [Neisseria weaveri LMG 5135]SAY51921.1 integral membrane protein [Neisseria weaveri]VEJ51337.1 integral membrane protein [Neisseria weaveri]